MFGEKPVFNFEAKNHVDLCTSLGLIDYERGVKLAGNGYWLYTDLGAQLEWALLNYFITTHIKDGYTFMLGTQSLFIQDMLGNTSMNFKTEMECVDVLVHSINMLVGSKKQLDKYGIHNFTELKEYAAAHPYEVSVGMLTATGVDGMCFEIATEGLSLNMVQYGGGAEVNADLAGGHCDLAVGGYDDMSGLIESGDIVPLLVFCEHRLSIFPDCECTAEVGIDSFAGPWRGIFAKKGTPQGAIDALVAAIEECRKDASWQEFLHNAAYDERTVPAPGEELKAFVQKEYKDLHDYMVEQETLEKDYEDLK